MSEETFEPYVRKRKLPVGVYRNRGSRYMSIVRHAGERHYLGSHDTVEEAEAQVAEFRKINPMQKRWD